MSSPSRIDINRENARHSTGPKTPQGKQKSSMNALRHGLTGQVVVMPTDDLRAYQAHVESFTDEYEPKGATESHLVQALADASWRLNRVAALESNVLSLSATGDPLVDALGIAASLESQCKALANLSMHTQRLSRQFERTVIQLRALQATRQAKEKKDLKHLLDIQEMCESRGETYDHSEDGFVFTDDQMNLAVQARNRRIMTREAKDFHYDAS